MTLQPAPRRAEDTGDGDLEIAVEPIDIADPSPLPPGVRRVLIYMMQGPYLRADANARLWEQLKAQEPLVRSRLADVYLDLVVDDEAGVAFVRHLDVDGAVKAIRTQPLTLIETALVLYLRRTLLKRDSGAVRVFVGRDEIEDQLRSYRAADISDKRGFDRRIEAAINKMKRYSVLLSVSGDDDRWEISPVLALVVGADEVAAITDELQRLLHDQGAQGDQT